MLRVTVMMFSDIVESVMLLKEEACNHTHRTFNSSVATSKRPQSLCRASITLSKRGGRCFLRRLWRLRSLEAVLCSVALLNLQQQASGGSDG